MHQATACETNLGGLRQQIVNGENDNLRTVRTRMTGLYKHYKSNRNRWSSPRTLMISAMQNDGKISERPTEQIIERKYDSGHLQNNEAQSAKTNFSAKKIIHPSTDSAVPKCQENHFKRSQPKRQNRPIGLLTVSWVLKRLLQTKNCILTLRLKSMCQ